MNHPKDHWDSFPVEDEKKILTDFTSATNKFMISAFSEERIIGNLSCLAMGGQFLMHNCRIGMGIEEEFQNLGVGTALLNYAIEIARSKGFSRLELNVRTFNTAGIALYEKIGFQKVGRLQKVAFIDGQYCDEFMYELLVTVA
jgi:RimJ/RimL family protein N-acetyltransferase